MIELLVTLLILAVIVYIAYLILGMLKIPPPLSTIIYIIAGLIVILVLLDKLGIYHVALK